MVEEAPSVAPNYDIQMLRVFLAVYESGSVTAAAERLFVSQPAVSQTLRKLRSHFGDPLFVRRGSGLFPSPVAEDRYPKIRRLLESLDEVVAPSHVFSPHTSTRRFRILMTELGISGLLPRLFQQLKAEAPGVTLEVEQLNLSTVVSQLRSGLTDAALCTTRLDADDLERVALFRQPYVGLCAVGHPRIGEQPSLEEYEAEEHVAVTSSTGHTALDEAVRDLGVQRRVGLVVPGFSSLPNLLAGTSLLSYAPASVAVRFTRSGLLQAFDFPFEVPVTEVGLYTVRRELPSQEFDWFRGLLVRSLG